MNQFYLKISTALVLTVAVFTQIACDSHGRPSMAYATSTTMMVITPQEPKTVWDRMAADFTFKAHQANPRVQRFIKQFTREDSAQLVQLSNQAVPFIYHIVKALDERGMPPELALLPIIESEYRPTA